LGPQGWHKGCTLAMHPALGSAALGELSLRVFKDGLKTEMMRGVCARARSLALLESSGSASSAAPQSGFCPRENPFRCSRTPRQGYAEVRDQFLLGDGILVAPILTKGKSSRMVRIPPGRFP